MANQTVTMETLQLELTNSLRALNCLKVLSVSSRHGDVRFLCRVEDPKRWQRALRSYLVREQLVSDWYSFIGTKYFVANNKVVFGWVLLWEAEDEDELTAVTEKVRKLLSEVREEIDGQVRNEVVSVGKPWANSNFEEKLESRIGKRDGKGRRS